MTRTLLTLLALLAGSSLAQAASGTAIFNGAVASACTITLATPGTLDVNTGATVLSSQQGVGVPAAMTVTATDALFNLTTEAPAAFSASTAPGANTAVGFESFYAASGATSTGITTGATPSLLGIGLTNLFVHLKATKSTGVFAAGTYTAQVVVRCE